MHSILTNLRQLVWPDIFGGWIKLTENLVWQAIYKHTLNFFYFIKIVTNGVLIYMTVTVDMPTASDYDWARWGLEWPHTFVHNKYTIVSIGLKSWLQIWKRYINKLLLSTRYSSTHVNNTSIGTWPIAIGNVVHIYISI